MKPHLISLVGCALVFIAMPLVSTAAPETRRFDIPVQELGEALRVFGRESGAQLVFDEQTVKGKRSSAVAGELSVDEALQQLLAGSGLLARRGKSGVLVIGPQQGAEVVGAPLDLHLAQAEGRSSGNTASSAPKESTAQNTAGPQEIVVTAQKREERLQDVPMSIVAMSGVDLERRGIDDFRELSYAVPELAVFSDGMGGSQLFLRGIGGVGGSEPLVGVYLDDLGVSGQSYYPLDVRTLDMERVEVLYGPQGTLYGQGSAGGTVKFITNKPAFDGFHLKSTLDVSSTQDGSPSEKVTGMVNLPLVDQVFALRIAGAYENSGGWVDAPSAGKDDINGGTLYSVRVMGQWNVTDAFTLTPMVIIYRNDIDSSGNGENADGNKILPPFAPRTIPGTHSDYDVYGLTARADLGRTELLSATSYYTTDGGGGFTNAFGTFYRSFETRNSSNVFNQEVRLSSKDTGRFNWTLGAFYSDVNYDGFTTLTAGPTVQFSFPSLEEGTSWSLFENMSYDLTDRVEIGGGVRYFRQQKTDGVENPHFSSVDPRIYASFAPVETMKVFVSAAKGFRGGGFNPIDPSFPPQFDPEKVYSYEVGTKFSALGSRLRTELSVFHSRYEDMQVDTLSPVSGLGYTGNVGRARIEGVDTSIQFDLTTQTTVGMIGSWLDTEVVDIAPGSGVAEGDRLNYIPKHSFGVFIQQKLTLPAKLPGMFRIDYNERGGSTFTSRGAGRIDESEPITMLNARVETTWSNLTFDVYGENLLNDRDRIIPNIVDFAPRPRPRTIGIRFGASF